MPRHLLYQAPQQNIADPQNGTVTRPWFMWFMDIIQTLTECGDVFGPASSTDNAIARWDGTTGKQIQNSVVTVADDGAFAFPDGIRQTFNPNATNAGVNVGAQAGDPSSLSNGDVWYNATTNLLRARVNGVSITLGVNGGVDYVVMSNGANPPTPVDDGAGNFIYIAYAP